MAISYRLDTPRGRPLIIGSDGKALPLCTASDCIIDIPVLKHSTPELWIERARLFAASGLHQWSLQTTRLPGHKRTTAHWPAAGEHPAEPAREGHGLWWQAERLLEIDPEARFFIRFGDEWPDTWAVANPGHLQENCTGRPRRWGAPQVSLASAAGHDDLRRYLVRLIEWCETQPWADRVFGYMYLPHGEGITNLVVSGAVFDVSPVMQIRFKEFLRARYADVAALQAAWGDPDVNFDTVRVPHDDEWRAAIAATRHWVAGDQLRRFRDYFDLQRDLTVAWYRGLIRASVAPRAARPSLFGIDMAKQHLLGWQHNLFFNGEGDGPRALDIFNASGSVDMGEVLDEPGLDMLLTPADYTARHSGYGWEPEGMGDSLRLRGKAILIENDFRTFCTTGGEHTTAGACRDIPEVRAGFLRNCAWILTRGGYDEWGTGGGGYYNHPDVQEHGIRPCVKLMNAAVDWPHRETEHAIAMIVDDTSVRDEDGTGGYQNLACVWQRCLGLAHCGIPYRIYLLSDLEQEAMPDYRAYWFPNLFRVTDERLALLERKVFRDGRLSIFGPATGITDGWTLSAAGASRVLGVEMQMADAAPMHRVIVRGNHPIVAALPANLTYGDSHPYGPILVPAEGAVAAAGAHELGLATMVWAFNRPGLFVKDHGTHKVAWTAAVPMPACLLRELARWGGCHVWCDDDAVILASDTVVALHTGKPGPHVIRLPEARHVREPLTDADLGTIAAIELDITPPATRIFRID